MLLTSLRGPCARVVAPIVLTAAATVGATLGMSAQRATAERHVFVTVVDRNDAPATGLAAADFVVREDGLAREILRATPSAAPLQVALLVDDSAVSQPLIAELRMGVASFLSKMLGAGAGHEIGIWTFGERPTRLADFTKVELELRTAADRIMPRAGSGAHMMDAVVDAGRALRRKNATRPIVVAFVVESGAEFSTPNRDNVERSLKEAGASLFVIALQSRTGAQSTEQRERATVISDVATASGGGLKVALSQQSIDLGFRTVASWITSQYDVAYSRPEALIPPTKRETSVKRDGTRVMASRWADR